ncbi:MAG: ATP-dependent helicase HrpB [Tepidisphaeraceae bacterium]
MTPLPIDPILPNVVAALAKSRSAVIVAPPGAGKTTRVPPAILAANLLGERHPNLVMLQPRRVAARAAAARIAEENGWQLGRQVGYHVRLEKVISSQTRLRVLTEGILTRQLLDDPYLDGVGAVILDEFHERSIDCDLAIALLREVRETVREDLILVVMSATLHAEPVARFLGDCPIIHSPGRLFDVRIEHRPPSAERIEDRVANEVRGALRMRPEESGDLLVFLPGAGEIRRTQERLDNNGALILPLHGSLPFEEQAQVLRPADRRKVILATNIAETSLTIPGVRTVIDSGLERVAAYDARRGLDQLQLCRISRASAVQRAGRAGRTAPGTCIRLWTAKEEAGMVEFSLPEIRRVGLCATVLALHAWGQKDPGQFGWYERPPDSSLQSAERLLWMLGALTDEHNGRITPLGRKMLALPVHPRLSRLMLAAAEEGLVSQGAKIAAVLSEREALSAPPPSNMHGSSDLLTRLDVSTDRPVIRLADELQRMMQRHGAKQDHQADESELLKLALLAYPDRVARRRKSDPETAVMVGGAGLRVARESVVRTAEFFVAVDVRQDDRAAKGESLVRVASAIEPEWLEELFPNAVQRRQSVRFDEQRGKVTALTEKVYLDLVLSHETDAAIDPSAAGVALAAALQPRARKIFADDEATATLLARLEFLRKWMPEHAWPVFDDAELAVVLDKACAGKRSVEELKRGGLENALRARLIYPLDRLLEQHAPASITVPSGQQIRLRYETGKSPVLAVRLQELFGLTQTPRLAGGKAPVLLELLGPNFRPVQVTEDLASFWKNTYEQVRKDLRRRYPKHSWPDDPLTALPTARGGRRRG